MIIAIGGPPGSGKTTVAERLARDHGYALVSVGARFREMAKARGLDLVAFSRAAEADRGIDRELDRIVLEEILRRDLKGDDVVVDGRIQAYLLSQRRIPCLKVWIDAPLDVRARRVADRDATDVPAARQEIEARERSERVRYREIYGIDLDDRRVYDLVVDSSDKPPERIVELVLARVAG